MFHQVTKENKIINSIFKKIMSDLESNENKKIKYADVLIFE